jgi:hypothetical protein
MLTGQDFDDPVLSGISTPHFVKKTNRVLVRESGNDVIAIQNLFKYSLLNKRIDDQTLVSHQNSENARNPSDKKYHEYISKSIKYHHPDVVAKI